jgi:hypothetical protein
MTFSHVNNEKITIGKAALGKIKLTQALFLLMLFYCMYISLIIVTKSHTSVLKWCQ